MDKRQAQKKAGKKVSATVILFPANRLVGLIRKEARAIAGWRARGLEDDARARWSSIIDGMADHLYAAGVSEAEAIKHLQEFREAVRIELVAMQTAADRSPGSAA